MSLDYIRASDAEIFKEAAVEYKSWILVRHTNKASLQYIGKPGFVPKPIYCKFKTADFGSRVNNRYYNVAGLVASPELLPGIFDTDKKKVVWNDNAGKMGLSKNQPAGVIKQSKFTVETDPQSSFYGCLKLYGKYVHGDYDLFDVIPMGHERRNLYSVNEVLHEEKHNRGPRVVQIQQYVNDRIGSEMVQHGGEAQYSNGYQAVYAFSPEKADKTTVYSWSEYQTRIKYENEWLRPMAGMDRKHLKE